MPAWLLPAIKAVLPHLGTIISVAKPVFTRKSAEAPADETTLQRQIVELQNAASTNDANIRALAEQMKTSIEALEKIATVADARHRRLLGYCISALLLSAAAFGIALILFFTAHVPA